MTDARPVEPDVEPRRQPGVVVRGLSVSYGDVVAVSGVDFHIEKGEVLGLLGPNGAGKSTIIDAITGLRAPSAGAIEICGVDLLRLDREGQRVAQEVGHLLHVGRRVVMSQNHGPLLPLELFDFPAERRAVVHSHLLFYLLFIIIKI